MTVIITIHDPRVLYNGRNSRNDSRKINQENRTYTLVYVSVRWAFIKSSNEETRAS